VRRWLAGLLAVALVPVGTARADAPPAPTTARTVLTAGQYLRSGDRLLSPNGRYVAMMDGHGRLVVRAVTGALRWRSPAAGAGAYLLLGDTGEVSVRTAGTARWSTHTHGSGRHDVLALRDDGVLALTAGGLTVWSTALPYACPATAGQVVVVDLSRQQARMCRSGQQLRVTFVTTGATARGDRTPTGHWRIYARVRNTTLRPSDGGAYAVRFWMPYSGDYGFHDASWQRLPYGSPGYRTSGSHGCVHVPPAMMRWLFGWARVGTRVVIQRQTRWKS
jgi:hypothetical protein